MEVLFFSNELEPRHDLCFDRKRPHFVWLVVQNRGHPDSRYTCSYTILGTWDVLISINGDHSDLAFKRMSWAKSPCSPLEHVGVAVRAPINMVDAKTERLKGSHLKGTLFLGFALCDSRWWLTGFASHQMHQVIESVPFDCTKGQSTSKVQLTQLGEWMAEGSPWRPETERSYSSS